jgi:hypothetical protein
MTKLEEIARVIGDVERQFKHTYSWERSDEDWKDLCRLRARAAIEGDAQAEPRNDVGRHRRYIGRYILRSLAMVRSKMARDN